MAIIRGWFAEFYDRQESVIEVGAGHSVAAQVLIERGESLAKLVITDASRGMLSYSKDYEVQGATLLVASADSLPVLAGSADVIVASLADPYNTLSFWKECRRILRPGGRVFFTTPSFEWATRFREYEGSPLHMAVFELRSGMHCLVPSEVLALEEQKALITAAELESKREVQVKLSELKNGRLSRKLLVNGSDLPVVTGYMAAAT